MKRYENVDSEGYDICHIPNKTIEEMVEIVKYMPLAEGFNSNGYIKFFCHQSKFVRAEGSTLYLLPPDHIDRQTYAGQYIVLCTATRDDVKEFVRMNFPTTSHRFLPQGTNVFEIVANESDVTPAVDANGVTGTPVPLSFLVLSDDIEQISKGFKDQLSHALAMAQEQHDVLILSNVDPLIENVLPKVVPSVIKGSQNPAAFVINKQGAAKVLSRQQVATFTAIPHLVRQ